ncbi:uroplakin-1a [Callorhinchus milii]|uniref:Tetraspanin n=1 Tax=Callorhinchus milii TaxID=7868 RepID=K4FXR9_CALMI|nr:uroplakin-1a [Callorhinchus milii]AFK10532.1 uroplakin 1b [Callorhinchus milii]|eukprot:gi/632937329/ref/XP_007899196.1/ PREDICTED: uroplakin-1b [Callorhinchus milii]
MAKGVKVVQGLLIFGNVVIMLCGLALTAECIYHVSDQHGLWPLLSAAHNDDIFAAAWIGLFTGFSFFILAIVGIVGVMKSFRGLLLAYLILMIIVFIFEVASCITAATHRDFFVPNFFLKQMLTLYENRNWQNDEQFQNYVGLTTAWKRIMPENECCGINGPQDWINFNSAFRESHLDADFPWPRQCCTTNSVAQIENVDACKLGVNGFVYTQGCFESIVGPLNRHTWGVAWFGFAILCWTFFVLVGTMYYYAILDI